MRKIILINCVWAAVAAGAFFLGQKDNANNPNQANSSSAAKSNQPYNKSINPNSSNRPAYQAKQAQLKKVQITQ